jgi:predicted transcriptional regulator
LIASRVQGKRRYLTITEKGSRVLKAMEELQVLL